MKNEILKFLNRMFNRCSNIATTLKYGKNITEHSDCFATVRALTEICSPKIVFDIGASNGHWSYVLSKMCPSCEEVVLFEPQKECIERLNQLILPGIKKTVCNYALGARKQNCFIAGGSAAASFLKDAPILNEYFPNIYDSSNKEQAEIKILDDIFIDSNFSVPDCIKIDVQGYELEVLKGSISTLKKTKYLILELSYQAFYQDQPQLWEILKFLSELDFVMISRGSELRSKDNTLLQVDGIFINEKLVKNERAKISA